MIPYFHIEYLQLGFIKIYSWGFFVSLGFLISLGYLIKSYPQEKNNFIDLALVVLLGAIFGSRLIYVAIYAPDTIEAFKNIFKIWEGGMSSFGGFFGGAFAALLFSYRKKIDLYKIAQKIAFILPLGLAIGRIGCFLINDHPGVPTSASPLSVSYPSGPRFDLGFLLMIFNALLFIYFIVVFKYSTSDRRKNILFLEQFLLIYGVGRFFLDFLRVDEPAYAGLIPSQYGSIVLVLFGTYLIIKKIKKHKI